MTYCTLSPATASSLFRHASAIRDELLTLSTFNDASFSMTSATDQALDEAMVERDVHIQAIEAFMAERSDLLKTIDHLQAVKADQARAISTLVNGVAARPQAIDTLGAENAKLRQDVTAMESVTLRAASFVDTLRTRLASIGVTFEMDELGDPALTVNALELANFMYAHMKAQAAG